MATGFKTTLSALIILGAPIWLHAFRDPSPPAALEGKFFEDRIEVPKSAAPLTPARIVSLLGNPQPFVLEVVEQRYIAIYCRAAKFSDCDSELLAKIKGDIFRLTTKPAEKPKPASTAYEYTVPHARALGDAAAIAKTLNFSALKIEAVGHDRIRISKTDGATESEFNSQLKIFWQDLDHLAWHIEPESPVARVYYVDAAPVADALNAKSPASSKEVPPPPNSGGQNQSAKDSPAEGPPNADQPAKPSPGAAAKPAKPKGAPKAGAGGAKPVTRKGGADAGTGGVAKPGSSSGGANAGPAGGANLATPQGGAKPGSPLGGGNGVTRDAGHATAQNPAAKANPANGRATPPPAPGNQPVDKAENSSQGKTDTPPPVSITAFNPDLLVFGDKNEGDDHDMAERKRVLAGIDFPRPEVIINTFSFQMSSSNSVVLANHDRILRTRIGTYNDSIQAALYRGWSYLEKRMAKPENFFDKPFYDYLTKRFVGLPREPSVETLGECTGSGQTMVANTQDTVVQKVTGGGAGTRPIRITANAETTPSCDTGPNWKRTNTTGYEYEPQYCQSNKYCLGYTSLFQPLRPILTDLLFAAVASGYPGAEFRCAMEQMEGFPYLNDYPDAYGPPKGLRSKKDNSNSTKDTSKKSDCQQNRFCTRPTEWNQLTCDEKDIEAWKKPDKLTATAPSPSSQRDVCQDLAQQSLTSSAQVSAPQTPTEIINAGVAEGIAQAQINTAKTISKRLALPGTRHDPNVFPMFCFREALEAAYPVDASENGYSSVNIGLPLRAALANFLFHYKMSQQYPHEFSGYDLEQSAQELNSELNPLIIAFNRDLAAALVPLEEVANCDVKDKDPCSRIGKGATKFVNNGTITVRTISGKKTTVDTVTQSFFDATNPPSITDIVNSIGKAESNVPNVLKTNLTANEAAVIIGALNSVPAATARVGRQFSIDITPRSLSGAASAELSVNLKTSDFDTPKRYTSEKSEDDNLSRIASQTVDTKVRLESVKLFEISSFTATLERSRRDFPILPPFVEIPYFGSFLSYPLQGATEFHRSTAIMSAVVVPTAADLANGVSFTSDRVCLPDFGLSGPLTSPSAQTSGSAGCRTRKAISLDDLDRAPIREFNKAMVRCFSSASPPAECSDLTFNKLLQID